MQAGVTATPQLLGATLEAQHRWDGTWYGFADMRGGYVPLRDAWDYQATAGIGATW